MKDRGIATLWAVVMPDGSLQLEWVLAGEPLSQSTELFQEDLHKRFAAGSETWLLHLGFSDKQIALSPSLSY